MIPELRFPPRRRKLHSSPLRALSPLSTPFLMDSSNLSESYHTALPCSLDKSSFFHHSHPVLPPSPPSPLSLALLSRVFTVTDVRRFSRRLRSLYFPMIPIYLMHHWCIRGLKALKKCFTLFHAFFLLSHFYSCSSNCGLNVLRCEEMIFLKVYLHFCCVTYALFIAVKYSIKLF